MQNKWTKISGIALASLLLIVVLFLLSAKKYIGQPPVVFVPTATTTVIIPPDMKEPVSPEPTKTDVPQSPVLPSPVPKSEEVVPPPVGGILWGAYPGGGTASDLQNFVSKVGLTPDIVATFVHWGNERDFPWDLAQSIRTKGKKLVIFWETIDYNEPNQTKFSYDSILKGDWDSYINEFASQAGVYGDPVILIPFEEMNGDWYPWSIVNGNSAEKHIAAWRYLREKFRNYANVKFAWVINSDSVPDTLENRYENYYPGDKYVDYVGVDGFNFGNPWVSFSEIFNNALGRLKAFNKPIYIFSFASMQGGEKASWIRDALTVQIPKHPEVVGWVWFNENKEKDWRIWSDSNSLDVFKEAVGKM